MKLMAHLLPEGEAIIAQDKRSAVLGQCPTKVLVPKGRCGIFSKEFFNGIHYLESVE
jgi:hypothetical protein